MDIMDAMLEKLESYATNLEELVAKRTSELFEEKKKTDMLLYRMLPVYVICSDRSHLEIIYDIKRNAVLLKKKIL